MASIVDFESLYLSLAAELEREKWFDRHWQARAGLYPDARAPKSVAIQVFKDTWFNEEGRGIHLESWMTNADVARGTAAFVLHIESSKERTGINGKTLVKALFESCGDKIRSWEGYQAKESYTMQPFIKRGVVTPDTFSKIAKAEFTRLAGIAKDIDAAIEKAKILS
ncbi:MAG TPA: hypothetical protein VIM61_09435 [Chthoniobacterales bacterium]|jgi:hypothetical protein